MRKRFSFIKTLAVFLGTVIGVGIFGLPFVALKAGFFVVFGYFFLMGVFSALIHLIYSEVAINTKKPHRLPGYVREYLGEKWKKFSFGVRVVGIMGALLAYLVIGGTFLNSLFSFIFGNHQVFYTLLFFSLGAYFVFRGIKSVAEVELVLFFVFLGVLFLFLFKGLPFINFEHFKNIDADFLFLPYGVVLFSLWGLAIVPEIKEMLNVSDKEKTRKKMKKLIIFGTILICLIYLLFIFTVLGVAGKETSEEAISGLADILGKDIVKIGFVFGIITCFTSFITLALSLKKVFWYDFGFSKNFSWFITCFFPLILFLLGLRRFIDIVAFTGALALGTEGIIVIFLYREFLKKRFRRKMNPLFYLLGMVFFLGLIFEIIYFLT